MKQLLDVEAHHDKFRIFTVKYLHKQFLIPQLYFEKQIFSAFVLRRCVLNTVEFQIVVNICSDFATILKSQSGFILYFVSMSLYSNDIYICVCMYL